MNKLFVPIFQERVIHLNVDIDSIDQIPFFKHQNSLPDIDEVAIFGDAFNLDGTLVAFVNIVDLFEFVHHNRGTLDFYLQVPKLEHRFYFLLRNLEEDVKSIVDARGDLEQSIILVDSVVFPRDLP